MKIKLLIIILILFLGILFPGCINESHNESNKEKDQLYFELNIYLENIENYTLLLPYPQNWTNFIEDLNLKNGIANYYLIDTKYGLSLRIDGENEIQLVGNKIIEDSENIELTLLKKNESILKSYVFCDKSPEIGNVTILFMFSKSSLNEKKGGIGYNIDSYLNNGWQEQKVIIEEIGG